MRQIVLDTETTGLAPEDGHRIIEIGCIELLERKITENRFHIYLNPDREIDSGAIEVHGISNEFLLDKPRFEDIVDDFLAYVEASELVIHNAAFDIGFLNSELRRLNRETSVESHCSVLDTLTLARKKHPGQRNSLDALCKRYGIDNSHRELHGALLDAEILAEVYLMMTGGQTSLLLESDDYTGISASPGETKKNTQRPELSIVFCNNDEVRLHTKYLDRIDKTSGGKCVWKAENTDGAEVENSSLN